MKKLLLIIIFGFITSSVYGSFFVSTRTNNPCILNIGKDGKLFIVLRLDKIYIVVFKNRTIILKGDFHPQHHLSYQNRKMGRELVDAINKEIRVCLNSKEK